MKKNILLLSFSHAMTVGANSLIVTSAALVASQLAPDAALSTLPLGIVPLATMLTTYPASMLMQRSGRRFGFAFGAICGLLGVLLLITGVSTDNFTIYCLGFLGAGTVRAFSQFFRFAAADTVEESYKAKAISLVMAGGVLGAFIGPNVAAATKDLLSPPFLGTFYALGLLYALVFAMVLFLKIPHMKTDKTRHDARPLLQIVRQPKLIIALLSALIGFSVMSLLMTATPLAMRTYGHSFGGTASVIQWHVFAMYAPSFFTGHLIRRFGVLNIIIAGGIINLFCTAIGMHGTSFLHFITCLSLLGLGWNFMFIGGTTLLTKCYRESERAKTQGLNDLLIFTIVTLAAFSSGALLHAWGWANLNTIAVPFILIATAATFWLKLHLKRMPVPAPA